MSITTRVEITEYPAEVVSVQAGTSIVSGVNTLATAREFTLTTLGTGFTVNNTTIDGGSIYYRHDQPVPATEWIVNHNIGMHPNVLAYSVGGARVDAEILHISTNQTHILFDSPFAGFAICS